MALAHTTLRTLAAVITISIFVSLLPGDTLARAMTSEQIDKPAPAPTATFAFASDEVAFETVLGVFTDAGLDVPALNVEFHDELDSCNGYWGLHVRTSDGRTTIHICFTHERQFMHEMTRTRTLLHEFAHAWVDENVSPTNLDAFMAIRGLTEWDTGEWALRGAEHAAEILMWGLQDEFGVSPVIPNTDDDELAAAFSILVAGA